MKNHLLQPILVQITKLRARMGDNTLPANEIMAGRYANGSKIRPNVHNRRICRLIKLEKRAAILLTEDFDRFIKKTGF
jgi:hypothetical protein